jgi:hypothetical protein
MTIKLVTFKTHQTIMGDVDDSPSLTDKIKIKQPVQVITVPPRSQTDPGGIAFAPYLMFCEEFTTGVEIPKEEILITTTPVLELLNQYNQTFGSGIQVAPKGFQL